MPVLTLDYRHCDRKRPRYIKYAEVEGIAALARQQLVGVAADALSLDVLSAVSGLKINGVVFDLFVGTGDVVHDEEGNPVLGICEYDPGVPDTAMVSVSPAGEGTSDELVLSTLAHELGHAVFDGPGWIVDAAPDLLSGWRYRAVIWSVVLAAAGYLGFALCSGWQDVVAAVAKVGFFGVVIALMLSLVNYGLRFIRWQMYLGAMGHPVPWWPSLKIYLAGFALTTTPGKAGEAFRGVLLKGWGVPYPTSLAAFLSERLSDLLAVVALTLVGLAIYPAAQPLILAGALALAGVFVVLSNGRLLKKIHGTIRGDSRLRTLSRHLIDVLLKARRCQSPILLGAATGLSLAAWVAEAWAFHLILQWMELKVSLPIAVFVYAISMLAGALSFLPGGLGGMEIVMIGLLQFTGVDQANAVAATVLIRLSTLWFAVLMGVILGITFRYPSSSGGVG